MLRVPPPHTHTRPDLSSKFPLTSTSTPGATFIGIGHVAGSQKSFVPVPLRRKSRISITRWRRRRGSGGDGGLLDGGITQHRRHPARPIYVGEPPNPPAAGTRRGDLKPERSRARSFLKRSEAHLWDEGRAVQRAGGGRGVTLVREVPPKLLFAVPRFFFAGCVCTGPGR